MNLNCQIFRSVEYQNFPWYVFVLEDISGNVQ